MRMTGPVVALLLALSPWLALAQTPASDESEPPSTSDSIPLDDIRRFVAVYNAVRSAWVEPVDDRTLMRSAIHGLLLELDPHSAYFDREQSQAFTEHTNGSYEGIGAELMLQPHNNTLLVIAPIDDTPAARAGLRSGDVITAIDGEPVSTIEAMEPLRGPAGTQVRLTVEREGQRPFDLTLTREIIRISSVRSRMLEPGYGYLRISAFQADTAPDFEKHIARLQQQSTGGLKGLVLDLRSNPGGLLSAAVQVADDLLDEGIIVSTRGRVALGDTRFEATAGDLLHGAPIMVLVDVGSASASEVLAAALRDNQRARLIGSRTFGKGSVQTIMPLDNGDSVKLTTARYYTPSGKSIQATGLVPDVELQPKTDANNADYPTWDVSEAQLPGHLRGEDEDTHEGVIGVVLPDEASIQAALRELKQPGVLAAETHARATQKAAQPND